MKVATLHKIIKTNGYQSNMKRILIDLTPEVHKSLRHKAIDQGKVLKTYIQEQLTILANKRIKHKDSPLDF